MKNVDILVKFIDDNDLQFNSTDSGLNSDCCVLSGFADYKGVESYEDLVKAVKKHKGVTRLPEHVKKEIKRVFNFAFYYNYGNWWKTEEARRTYTF